MRRRRLLATGLAALAAPAVRAQPSRPLLLVVPYAAGGGTDIAAREFAHALQEALGQTVVVENRGGAAGHVGAVGVARSRPDGNTLLYAVSTNLVINPHMQRNDGVDILTALVPVAQVTSYQYVLVIDPRLPPRSLQDLLAYARSKPAGELTYSSGGVGNNNHLAGVVFSEAARLQMEHVPYRGTAPALMDVVGGRISMNFSSPPPAIPLVREGQLRALAVTGERRLPALPEVPTLTEAGLPNAVILGWHGVFAPSGTPAPVLDRLEAAARRAAASPRFAGRLETDGLEPAPARPRAEFAAAVRTEAEYWGRKVRELDLRLE